MGGSIELDRGVPPCSIYAELDRVFCETEQVAWLKQQHTMDARTLNPSTEDVGDVAGLLQGNDRGHK